MIEVVNEILPTDKPRYLMGVGTPMNLLEAIERGVDMFDCVMPTRNGRNGMLFTKDGIINMKNKKWEFDFSPIEADGASVDNMQCVRVLCAITDTSAKIRETLFFLSLLSFSYGLSCLLCLLRNEYLRQSFLQSWQQNP